MVLLYWPMAIRAVDAGGRRREEAGKEGRREGGRQEKVLV